MEVLSGMLLGGDFFGRPQLKVKDVFVVALGDALPLCVVVLGDGSEKKS